MILTLSSGFLPFCFFYHGILWYMICEVCFQNIFACREECSVVISGKVHNTTPNISSNIQPCTRNRRLDLTQKILLIVVKEVKCPVIIGILIVLIVMLNPVLGYNNKSCAWSRNRSPANPLQIHLSPFGTEIIEIVGTK